MLAHRLREHKALEMSRSSLPNDSRVFEWNHRRPSWSRGTVSYGKVAEDFAKKTKKPQIAIRAWDTALRLRGRARRRHDGRVHELDRDGGERRGAVRGQVPLLAPLAQLLSGLLLMRPQFGEDSGVDAVDRRGCVLADVCLGR
jgi:hypothetical protein